MPNGYTIIDGRGHLVGRLASVVAKQLLEGKKLVVVRAEEMNISGSLYRNKVKWMRFLKKRLSTNPKKGPYVFIYSRCRSIFNQVAFEHLKKTTTFPRFETNIRVRDYHNRIARSHRSLTSRRRCDTRRQPLKHKQISQVSSTFPFEDVLPCRQRYGTS